VRSGEAVDNSELIRFASLFNDELTLDNLSRVQLASICQFVGITPFGTDAFLRSRLRAHLAKIKTDDADIRAEGIAALSDEELRGACRDRGMRAPYGQGAAAFMARQLEDWLELSLDRGLPSSLLLLSRAFTITAGTRPGAGAEEAEQARIESLKATLSTLPEEAIEDVEYEACKTGGRVAELEKKLRDLKCVVFGGVVGVLGFCCCFCRGFAAGF